VFPACWPHMRLEVYHSTLIAPCVRGAGLGGLLPSSFAPGMAASRPVAANPGLVPEQKECATPGLPPWGPRVRFRRVQTLVREGSPLVKLRNSGQHAEDPFAVSSLTTFVVFWVPDVTAAELKAHS